MTDVATNPTSPYSNFDYGQVQTAVTMPDPYMAALRYGMLEDVREQVQQRLQRGYADPLDYRVAPISTGEQMGIQTAQQGLGAFMPFLQAGETAIQGGQNILTQQASPYLQQAFQAAGGGQELINQALGLAQAQRAVPYTYQQGAAQGIGQGTQLGTTLGLQAMQQVQAGAGLGTQAANLAAQQLGGLSGQVGGQVGGAQSAANLAAQRARQSTAAAQQGLMQAGAFGQGAAQMGIGALMGTGGRFDPSQVSPFMSAFEDAAIQQTLADIQRQGDIAQQGVRAQAVGAGAFGGSRQAVAEQELQRNVLEQQARTAAQMRAGGFESAAQRAQQAFEQQLARQQQAAGLTGQLGQAGAGTALQAAGQAGQLGLSAEQLAQTGAFQGGQLGLSGIGQAGQLQQAAGGFGLQAGQQQIGAGQAAGQLGTNLGQLGLAGSQALGQLGLQYGQLGQQDVNQLAQLAQQQGALGQGIGALAGQAGTLGTQLGQLGVQQAGIGEIGQNITSSQLQNVFAAGGLERGIAQSALDAARLSNVQREAFPYQQYGFLADIYAGVPSAQSVSTGVAGTQTSPFQTALGLGIQGLAAASGAQRAGLI